MQIDQQVLADMAVYWPSNQPNGDCFWDHEYSACFTPRFVDIYISLPCIFCVCTGSAHVYFPAMHDRFLCAAKHGVCATNVPELSTQGKFFTTTIALNKQYNALAILLAAGITPDDNNAINTDQAQQALDQGFGANTPSGSVRTILICKGKRHQPKVLDSFMLCFDTSLNPADCTGMHSKCEDEFIMPATPTQQSESPRSNRNERRAQPEIDDSGRRRAQPEPDDLEAEL